jgi:hypothetical protein
LIRDAWIVIELCDGIEILASAVKATEMLIPEEISRDELESLDMCLGKALDWLRRRGPRPDKNIVSAVYGLKDMVHDRWKAALGESCMIPQGESHMISQGESHMIPQGEPDDNWPPDLIMSQEAWNHDDQDDLAWEELARKAMFPVSA